MASLKDQSRSFPLRRVVVFQQTTQPDINAFPGAIHTVTRTRLGSRNPNWKKQVASGQNATTSLTAYWDTADIQKGEILYEAENPSLGYWRKSSNKGDLFPGLLTLPYAVPTLSTSVADNGARTKFYKKLRSYAVQVSGPTFLGELRETVRMIKKPAAAFHEGLEEYCRQLRRKAPRKPKTSRSDQSKKAKSEWKNYAKNLSQTAGGLWLEKAFGWIPLISDVEEGLEAYERLSQPRYSKRISASYKDFKDTSNTLGSVWNAASTGYPNSYLYVLVRGQRTEDCVVRYRGAVESQAEGMTPVDKLALFGFTPTEVLPTAWELLPWSFLIDYFTNIGDLISASVTDTSRVTFVNQTVIRNTMLNAQIIPDWVRTSNYHASAGYIMRRMEYSPGNVLLTRKNVVRSPGLSVPLPSFECNLPGTGQLFNIAALVSQMTDLHPQRVRRNYRL